jgi:hypothetical protein
VLQQARAAIPTKTPLTVGIDTQQKLLEPFASLKGGNVDDNIAFMSPYDPKRGIALKVECLRGVTPERCLYKVLVETVTESATVKNYFTELHDFDSDIGVPGFRDDPFAFPDIKYSETSCLLFRVFKMIDPSIDNPGGIMQAAWSATKIFLEDGVARLGRFSVPMFAGTPPPKMLDELKSEKIDQVILKWTSNPPSGYPKVEFFRPNALITFVQGDSLRVAEFTEQKDPFRVEPRTLLILPRFKKDFPCQDDEGYHEELLSVVIPQGVTPPQFEDAMNKQMKKFFKKM